MIAKDGNISGDRRTVKVQHRFPECFYCLFRQMSFSNIELYEIVGNLRNRILITASGIDMRPLRFKLSNGFEKQLCFPRYKSNR